ncbi:MAG: hypothetical protein AB1298_05930, partial [Bacteroidota bacterium]
GEVNTRLKLVKRQNEEISGIIALQKKTRKFLEEVEFSSNIDKTAISLRSAEPTTTSSPLSSGNYGDKTSVNQGGGILSQMQTYIYLLKQLDFKTQSNLKTTDRFSFDAVKKNISLQEYYELLAEVEKRLTDYQIVLTNKIGSSK